MRHRLTTPGRFVGIVFHGHSQLEGPRLGFRLRSEIPAGSRASRASSSSVSHRLVLPEADRFHPHAAAPRPQNDSSSRTTRSEPSSTGSRTSGADFATSPPPKLGSPSSEPDEQRARNRFDEPADLHRTNVRAPQPTLTSRRQKSCVLAGQRHIRQPTFFDDALFFAVTQRRISNAATETAHLQAPSQTRPEIQDLWQRARSSAECHAHAGVDSSSL